MVLNISSSSDALNINSQELKKSFSDSRNKNSEAENAERYRIDDEKVENEIWKGVKSEQLGNLERAASHYRLAIRYNPECAKAYRLLANILKKIRESKFPQQLMASRFPLQPNLLEKPLKNSFRLAKNMLDNKIAMRAETADNAALSTTALAWNQQQSKCITISSLSDLNIILSSLNLNVNNTDLSSSSQQNEIVVLPDMGTSPSGDLVLQDNLAVSQLYLEQALVFFEQKQWDRSILSCQEALRLCPNLGEAYKIWGNCLQQSGNSADAIGIYAKALELQPNMAEIYCNLGSIYAKSKKWKQAVEHYQRSTVIDPNFAAPHRNLARVWDELGQYDKSEESFFRAIAIKPDLISAKNHFDLAHNLAEEKKLDKAIACYRNCVELEPNFLNAYVRLAQLLEEVGEKEEALYYYKKLAQLQTEGRNGGSQPKSRQQIHSFLFGKKKKSAPQPLSQAPAVFKGSKTTKPLPQLAPVKAASKKKQIAEVLKQAQRRPDSASLQFELGNLYFLDGQWQNAIAYYLKAIKLEPNQTKSYVNLGKAWEKSGDTIKANQAFYQAFSLEPEKVSAKNHLLLGNKLLEQRLIKPAVSCYRRAITQQPEMLDAYWQLGRILLGSGNEQGAIACYRQAIKINPQNSIGYLGLGNALAQAKQEQTAIDCYRRGADVDPSNADIQHNLGEVLYSVEDWQNAATAYQKAIALNPQNSWSHNNLGNALLKIEQWSAAADSFRRAIELKPDFVWSHYNLGEALAALEQWDEALTAYQLAQKLDPSLPMVKQKIGGMLHKRSKNSQHEALSFCEAQIKEDPDNIELYHQAISLNRKDHRLYLGLGKALAKKAKLDEAISIFQMGLELEPDSVELSSELSKVIQAKNPELDEQAVAEKVRGLIHQ